MTCVKTKEAVYITMAYRYFPITLAIKPEHFNDVTTGQMVKLLVVNAVYFFATDLSPTVVSQPPFIRIRQGEADRGFCFLNLFNRRTVTKFTELGGIRMAFYQIDDAVVIHKTTDHRVSNTTVWLDASLLAKHFANRTAGLFTCLLSNQIQKARGFFESQARRIPLPV